jgi:cytoskeletal protein CcmA (bactofilin family)
MSAVESDGAPERGAPDLSFLDRATPRSPDIPNLAPATNDRADDRSRRGNGKVLTVGSGISVTGEITACDTLVVEGNVAATLTDSRTLDILRGGAFNGRAEVQNAVIAGLFDGDLMVRERLQIASSGHVKGKVRYGKLEIESGGELNGDIASSETGR